MSARRRRVAYSMEPTQALLRARELRVLSSAENRTLYFHGESMRLFFLEGDGLVVQPVDWREIRVGDIVTYRSGDKFPTRRVVRKLDESLVLWCDNWPGRRFRTPRKDVLGKVVARARSGSWLTHSDPEWKRATRRALVKFYTVALANKAFRTLAKAKKNSPRFEKKIGSSSRSNFSS